MQPHRSETFKLSSDPLFVDKVRDIVGLYLSPPETGMPERRTHDYKRGTTSLFAALVIGKCRAREAEGSDIMTTRWLAMHDDLAPANAGSGAAMLRERFDKRRWRGWLQKPAQVTSERLS